MIEQVVWWILTNPFWFAFGASQVPIRWLADGSPRARLYWENGHFKFSHDGGTPRQKRTPKQNAKIHLHHFIWGIPSTIIGAFVIATVYQAAGFLLVGFGASLWFSEIKELILQTWQP